MGLYIRKSIRVGPLRFNLSKGGVGVSAGVKGFRFGTGPRGNYVHMGAGGVYYRSTIPSGPDRPRTASRQAPRTKASQTPDGFSRTHGPMVDIDSAEATTIVDSSSKALLDELNTKQRKLRFWPSVATISALVLLLALVKGAPTWALMLLATLGIASTVAMHTKDQLRKTVVLMYELDGSMEHALEALHAGAGTLISAHTTWHISSHATVLDRKYHAGASKVVERKVTRFAPASPPFVRTNVETIAVNVGAQTLYFFPDRVLIYDSNGVGAVTYQGLQVFVSSKHFVENEGVPRDAIIVGHTWRYVNKNGGPDRRFKDNREIPICHYEEIALRSDTGLNELLQSSRLGSASGFASAIATLGRIMPKEIVHRPESSLYPD